MHFSTKALISAMVLFIATPTMAALFDDDATGNWKADNADTWGQGIGAFPGPGDHIVKDSGVDITVTENQSFGDAANQSNNGSGGGNGSIIINAGMTLTHVAGSTFDTNNGTTILTGPGTYNNAGTWLLDGDAGVRPVIFNGDLEFHNTGTFQSDDRKPEVNINGANGVFRNSGTVSSQNGGGNFIFQGAGTFINEASGIVENLTNGDDDLVIATATIISNGGTWNNDNNRETILRDANISGTFNGSGDGFLRLDSVTVDGAATFNVNGGTLYYFNDGSISLGAGGTLTNQGNLLIDSGGGGGTNTFGGTGTFRNEGTTTLDTDGRTLRFVSGQVAENAGTFRWTNKTDVELADADVTFTNEATGIIQVDTDSTPKTFKGDGIFIGLAGNSFDINGKDLTFENGTAAGGNRIEGANIDITSGDSLLIGGFWEKLEGVASGAGEMRLLSSFRPETGGAVLNVTGNGLEWEKSTLNTSGETITNKGLIVKRGDREDLSGGGTLLNEGTFQWVSGNDIEIKSNTTFDNTGTFDYQDANDLKIQESSAVFRNSGLLQNNDTSTAEIEGDGAFENIGGDIHAKSGNIRITPDGGPNGSKSTGGNFLADGNTIEFGGAWSELTGVASGNVELDEANFSAAAANTVINVTGDGIVWKDRNFFIDTNGGTVDNQGLMKYDADRRTIGGGGTFLNSGEFRHNNNKEIHVNNGTSFENSGLFLFNNDGAHFEMQGANAKWINRVGGTIKVAFGNKNDDGRIDDDGEFSNLGTVLVEGGEFKVDSSIFVRQFEETPGTLTNGTWIIRDLDGAGGNESRISPEGVTGATTFAAPTKVVLDGPDSFFQIGSLDTNHGHFEIRNGRDFDIGAFGGTGDYTNTGTTVVGPNSTLSDNGGSTNTVINTGMIIVEAGGTFEVDGGAGSINNTGGTVAGNGTIAASVLGGSYDPGASPGTLTIEQDASWENGGSYLLDINDVTQAPTAGAGTDWDLLQVENLLNITASGGGFLFDISTEIVDTSLVGDFSILVADAGSLSGFDPTAFSFNAPDFDGTFGVALGTDLNLGDDTQVFVTYTAPQAQAAVPEPGTALLGLLAAAGLTVGMRRRRNA